MGQRANRLSEFLLTPLPEPCVVLRELPVPETIQVRSRNLLPLDSAALLGFFRNYQGDWNSVVLADREGLRLPPTPSKAHKDYLHRKLSRSLRLKSWKRTTSIPVTKEIRSVLKGLVQLDWRRVTKPRLLRRGSRVFLSYVSLQNRPEAILDPRKVDVGITLTTDGLTLAVQSPMETVQFRHINIKNLSMEVVKELVRHLGLYARVVALDECIPHELRTVARGLIKGLRNKQAEGAIVFRSPKWVSLGAKYYDKPEGSPDRWKYTTRKELSRYRDSFVMLGLTGRPLMVSVQNGALVNVDGSQVSPLERAFNVVHTVLAKLDLWHLATVLNSKDRQRVQSAFHRWSRKTIMTMQTKRA